eukprot:3070-Heterococcus_DN1.PRE.5
MYHPLVQLYLSLAIVTHHYLCPNAVCHVQAWLDKHFDKIDKDTAKALCFLISFTLYHTHRDVSTFHRYEHTQVTLATIKKFTSDVANKVSSPR